MPWHRFLEHPVWHLIGWCCGATVFSLTGGSIEELLAHRVIAPYVAPYLSLLSASLAIFAALMLLLVFELRRRYGKKFEEEKQPKILRAIYRRRGFLAFMFILISGTTLVRSLATAEDCHVLITHPDDQADVGGRFNVRGRIGNPDSCPSVQIWLRDLGGRSKWSLLDEVLVQQDSKKWGSRYVDLGEEHLRGPEVEIRAIGWRKSFGPEELNREPPVGYLQRADAHTVRIKD